MDLMSQLTSQQFVIEISNRINVITHDNLHKNKSSKTLKKKKKGRVGGYVKKG